MKDKKTEYDINKKPLHIYCLSDLHLGSNVCNTEFLEYALDLIKKDKHEKIIYLNGDLLEVGSRSVGNSAFKQKINVNEQLDQCLDYFEPFKDIIHGLTKGNHDSKRLLRDFDFDLTEVMARSLETSASNYIEDTLTINERPYNVYCTHGKGSSRQLHLALGKVVRETGYRGADLNFYGHLHRTGATFEEYYNKGVLNRRWYVLTGSFLSYHNSYAEEMGLNPVSEGFTCVSVDKDLQTSVDYIFCDEVL